jgi:PAS domain S-box-containing protein
MKPEEQQSPPPHRPDLRQRAEELLRTTQTDLADMPGEDVQRLVHELQVHQIELELQNEELREAQVELAESRDRYSDLYEFAPIGYLSLDRDGEIREANLTAATMLEVERGELPGAKVTAFVARESQDDFYLHRREVFSSEAKHVCEIGMRTAGGKLMAVRLECVAYGPEDDRCCRTALIDVTERKEAEMALHMLNIDLGQSLEDSMGELRDRLAELRLLSEAVSSLGEGVMITGSGLDWPETEILFVNDAMCRISGYTRAELFGRTPGILHGAATDQAAMERSKAELSARRSLLVELTNYRKDGSPYQVGLVIAPLLDSNGRRTNFVMVHRDITTRKQLEQEVIKAAEEERQRIAHDLHDDLGSLLTGIKLATEAQAGAMDRAGTGDAGKCRIIAQQVGEAITKTRGIARGLHPVGPEPEDLMDALRGLSRQTEESTELRCRCDCPDPVVLDEPVVANHLFRIVQEAVNNAVKHSGGTGITIALRQQDGTVELRIDDDGSGFDPSRGQDGGLGLHIMHYRAHAVSASLRIEHREGGGTSVVCVVPQPNSR